MEDLVGNKWIPGMNAPFDPIAAQLAKKNDLTVIVTNGNDFKNFENILEFESFKGTVITPYRIDSAFYDREYYEGKKGKHRLGYKVNALGSSFQGITNFYRAFLIKTFINPKNCLDIGCGNGNLIKWLRFFGIDAHGVELSKYALELLDPKIKPYVKEADLIDLPYKDEEFDLVISFDVLEHVERGKIKKAALEAVRVSKKYILHKIYTRENLWITLLHRKDFSHVSVLPRVRWKSIFSSLQNVSILHNSFFHLPIFMETIFLLKKK
jgi:SAM-dependent methyltransferase